MLELTYNVPLIHAVGEYKPLHYQTMRNYNTSTNHTDSTKPLFFIYGVCAPFLFNFYARY
jgi:hypothetical protein